MDGKKLNKAIKHLLKLEKKTGGSLRIIARGLPWDCPVKNFAPEKDRDGGTFVGVEILSAVYSNGKRYRVDSPFDAHWWNKLNSKEAGEYTDAIQNWLERRV